MDDFATMLNELAQRASMDKRSNDKERLATARIIARTVNTWNSLKQELKVCITIAGTVTEVLDSRAALAKSMEKARHRAETQINTLANSVRDERTKHAATLERLQRQSDAMQEAQRKVAEERRVERAEAAQTHAQLKSAHKRLDEANEAQRMQRSKIDTLNAEMAELRAQLVDHKQTRLELADTRAKLAEAQREAADASTLQQSELKRMASRLGVATGEIEHLKQRNETIDTQRSTLERQCDELRRAAEQTMHAVTRTTDEQRKADALLKTAQRVAERAKTAQSTAEKERDEAQRAVVEVRAEYKKLTTECVVHQRALCEERTRVEQLESDLEEKRRQVEEHIKSMRDAHAVELAALKANIAELSAALSTAKERLESLSDERARTDAADELRDAFFNGGGFEMDDDAERLIGLKAADNRNDDFYAVDEERRGTFLSSFSTPLSKEYGTQHHRALTPRSAYASPQSFTYASASSSSAHFPAIRPATQHLNWYEPDPKDSVLLIEV